MLTSGDHLPGNSDARPFIAAARMLAAEEHPFDFDSTREVDQFRQLFTRCAELCNQILSAPIYISNDWYQVDPGIDEEYVGPVEYDDLEGEEDIPGES